MKNTRNAELLASVFHIYEDEVANVISNLEWRKIYL